MLQNSLICAGFRYKKTGVLNSDRVFARMYYKGLSVYLFGVKARRKGIAGKIRC